ncbi:MAG: Holliday junction branch migration protein RuvA [Alphaproteobacteria bacterium]
MIASLHGIVDLVGADHAVIDVNGVGYHVFASARTLGRMSKGERVRISVETHVREDHIHLYGFGDPAERDWFRLLTTVQGVGARTALSILSALSPADLVQAIAAQDKAPVTRADGVGPKLANRIVTELKDKVAKMSLGAGALLAVPEGLAPDGTALNDAISALVNLGYGKSEAYGAVARVSQRLGKDVGAETLIKAGLKELSA